MSRVSDEATHEEDALLDGVIERLRVCAEPVVHHNATTRLREGRVDPIIHDAGKLVAALFRDTKLPEATIEELTESLGRHLTPGDLKDIVSVRTERLARRATGQWIDLMSDALEVQHPLLLGVDLLPPAVNATIGATWEGAPTWAEDWESVLAGEGLDLPEGVEMMANLRLTVLEQRAFDLPLGIRLRSPGPVWETGPALVWALGPDDEEEDVGGFSLAAVRLLVPEHEAWHVVPPIRELLGAFVRQDARYRQATVLATADATPRHLYCVCEVDEGELKSAGEHLAEILQAKMGAEGRVRIESVESLQDKAYATA